MLAYLLDWNDSIGSFAVAVAVVSAIAIIGVIAKLVNNRSNDD